MCDMCACAVCDDVHMLCVHACDMCVCAVCDVCVHAVCDDVHHVLCECHSLWGSKDNFVESVWFSPPIGKLGSLDLPSESLYYSYQQIVEQPTVCWK